MKKLPDNFYIIIHSDAHSKLVQDKLFELGYVWTIVGKNYNDYTIGFPRYPYGSFVILGYSSKNLSYVDMRPEGSTTFTVRVSTDDLLSVLPTKEKTVVLNENYSAIVSGDGTFKVGCQTFSHEIVKALVKAIEEVTK